MILSDAGINWADLDILSDAGVNFADLDMLSERRALTGSNIGDVSAEELIGRICRCLERCRDKLVGHRMFMSDAEINFSRPRCSC